MATKNKVGRPTNYKKEYAEQARKLCLLGHTDAELAEFFDVSEQTINAWKKAHAEFLESIKKGKAVADGEVASKLFHRATGYEHPEDDIRAVEGKIVITPTVKHYPPDTTAAIFWLKNRQGKKWRDKQDINHLSEDGSMTPRGLDDFYSTIEAEPQSGVETVLEDESKE